MASAQSKTPLSATPSESHSQYVNELSGLIALAAALFTLASFGSHHLGLENTWGGVLGTTLARGLAGLFGYAVYVIPLALFVLGVRFFRGGLDEFPLSRFGAWTIVLLLLSAMLGLFDPTGTKGAAGWVGGFLGTLLLNWCGLVGASLVLSVGILTTLSYVAGTPPLRFLNLVRRVQPRIRVAVEPSPRRSSSQSRRWDIITGTAPSRTNSQPPTLDEAERHSPLGSSQPTLPLLEKDDYQLPPSHLLEKPKPSQRQVADAALLQRHAEIVEDKLAHFGIEARVVAVQPGPVITTFEIELAPGIKVQRVVSLQDDLSMALRSAVRVIAPIPGKSVVGIEVANERRERVYLSEIISSEAFQQASSCLTLALGKDTAGAARVEDLARMPHLLIAGATGTGKSVFLNALIMSILSKASPRDVRFVMIDLKMLELSLYEELPHQLVPVVTDTKKALVVLNNLCREMDRRYLLLKDKGVRNIDAYNALLAKEAAEPVIDLGKVATIEDVPEAMPALDEEFSGEPLTNELSHEHMPKIVIIIDELADLMLTSSRNVETPITRLAQKARACGIHLIVATQRPSVDVITGLIKANFPARISFQVPTRNDSVTILGCMGAERLLGEGDMLFLQPGKAMERLHGAFVGERDIHRFTEFVKGQAKPQYAHSLLQDIQGEGSGSDSGTESESEEDDELYDQAVRIVVESRIASISYLQRRLRIGYNRAARLVERMEREGVVSSSVNGRPREVLVPSPPES